MIHSLSEEDLEAEPEHVARQLEAVRGEADRVAELGVLPAEVDLDVLGQVPVDPRIDQVGAVAPEVRVGQAGGEDPVVDVEQAVAPGQLDGPRAALALADVEG